MLLLSLFFYFQLFFFAGLALALINFSIVFPFLMRLLGKGCRLIRKGLSKSNSSLTEPAKENPFVFRFETTDDKWVSVQNPFRGTLVVGGAGSGKTETYANAIIRQAVDKNYCGIVYDFKYPALTNELQAAIEAAKINTVKKNEVKFFTINFEDLKNSNRVNPLHPRYIKSISHAEEYATAIVNNLIPESIQRTDFWVRSSIALLQAAIWYFREERSENCDLPHIVRFLQSDPKEFLELMRQHPICQNLISSILTAYDRKADNQLAGTIGTLQLALNKICAPEISYVLSGNDFDLNLNNPEAPAFLALGNTPGLMDTFSPVLSLITTVALKMMNEEGKQHSLVLLDEAPTLYIPKLETLPATGRSRKIAVVFMCQDISQINDKYGNTKKETIISNLANQFYGRVSNLQTAEYISKLVGRKDVRMENFGISSTTSHSYGRRNSGTASTNESLSHGYNWQERPVLKPQAIFGFKQGQFASLIAEREDHLSPVFVANYKRIPPFKKQSTVL